MRIFQTQQDIVTLRSTDTLSTLLSHIQARFEHLQSIHDTESDTEQAEDSQVFHESGAC
ncbi:hypothetical protein [Paenibacillus wulumuqiensis]|uniref:hypothetical protein n=1 Tax=Paenibacillus wulumuqiensis TaxID=1567107 RepID=UPI000B0A1DB4|nr:hypothetical protein [Paenibacillus wulumuqiensis]